MSDETEEQQDPNNISKEAEEQEQERELWWEHAPLLYDVIISKGLVWPSLSVQFMPLILFVH